MSPCMKVLQPLLLKSDPRLTAFLAVGDQALNNLILHGIDRLAYAIAVHLYTLEQNKNVKLFNHS